MRIAELARCAGVNIQTLYFYERKGLMPAPPRGLNGYRNYTSEHLKRLVFIQHCRALDIPLAEIEQLTRLRETPSKDCAVARALVVQNRERVRKRIASLQALERHLVALQARCSGSNNAAHCGILAELATFPMTECSACKGDDAAVCP